MPRFMSAASAAVLLLSALSPLPALAQDMGTMRVRTADVRLASPSGADVAYARIRMAARTFCGDESSVRQLSQVAEIHRCVQRMTYLAVSKLDAPLVTARYDKSGATPPILLASR